MTAARCGKVKGIEKRDDLVRKMLQDASAPIVKIFRFSSSKFELIGRGSIEMKSIRLPASRHDYERPIGLKPLKHASSSPIAAEPCFPFLGLGENDRHGLGTDLANFH